MGNLVVEPCKIREVFFLFGGAGKAASGDVSLWMVR